MLKCISVSPSGGEDWEMIRKNTLHFQFSSTEKTLCYVLHVALKASRPAAGALSLMPLPPRARTNTLALKRSALNSSPHL